MTEPETVETDETPVTVTLPEPESTSTEPDGNDNEPANDNATPEQRITRREKREQRNASYKEQQSRAQEYERRFAEADASRQRLETQLAEMRGRTEQMQRQATQAQGDPVERQITELSAKARRHLAAAANAKDPETANTEMDEYHKAQRRAAVIEARQEMRGDMQQMQRSMPNPEQAGMKMALVSDYPWLESNESARNAADAYIALLLSRDKRPNNLATFREACALAARDFGLGGAVERPSAARRSAYNGVTARNGAGGDDGRLQLQMSTDDNGKLKTMARQMYPQLEPDEAYKRWLRDVAPKLSKK